MDRQTHPHQGKTAPSPIRGKQHLLATRRAPSLICSAWEPWEPGALGSLLQIRNLTVQHHDFYYPRRGGSDSNPRENPNTPLFIRLFQKTQKLNK